MSLAYSINTWVAAGIGGIDTTSLNPPKAEEVFVRVSRLSHCTLGPSDSTLTRRLTGTIVSLDRRAFLGHLPCQHKDLCLALLSAHLYH